MQEQEGGNQQQIRTFQTSILGEMPEVIPFINFQVPGLLTTHNNIDKSLQQREETEQARSSYRPKMQEEPVLDELDEEIQNHYDQGQQQKEKIALKQVVKFVLRVITNQGQIPDKKLKPILIREKQEQLGYKMQQKDIRNLIRRCYDSINVLKVTSHIEQLPNKNLILSKSLGRQAQLKKQHLQRQIKQKEEMIKMKKDKIYITKDSIGRLELLLKRNIQFHATVQNKIQLNLIAYMEDDPVKVPKLQKKGCKTQIYIPTKQLLTQSQLLEIIEQSYKNKL